MKKIEPIRIFKSELPNIKKPMRYLGGESTSIVKQENCFNIALCFPDLYEIGMSNNAMRILYSGLNRINGISCERVFSVADDFEQLLRKKNIGLYGLETGLPVVEFDILAFTIGYELAATNILNVLDICNIPIYKNKRLSNHPIVIAGGPAITNPVPYSNIFDTVWIGEAEQKFFLIIEELSEMKKYGANRSTLIDKLASESSFWIPGKKTIRNIFRGFGESKSDIKFPSSVLKPIQSHGVVEIMRGCPNGCRFCHAGYYYRPVRYRNPINIINEVERLITQEGHTEISLSSLSSGDYPGIVNLVKFLKKKWAEHGVSFQLPSLRIESFPIELIEEISSTRKGGLTFAVETALEIWQKAVNKLVSIEKIESILNEAVNKGYKIAKFYFMIGLFIQPTDSAEEDKIIDLIEDILKKTKNIKINITLATFVPKPFTPFQWNAQLNPEDASKIIYKIKDAFKNNARIKISYNSPYLSWLEGIISRGDERVGELIINAFKNGARFDAWDDLFNKTAWEKALKHSDDLIKDIMIEKNKEIKLPWSLISLLVSNGYFKSELSKSRQYLLTAKCDDKCHRPCGSCSDGIVEDSKNIVAMIDQMLNNQTVATSVTSSDQNYIRILFEYSKVGRAAYIPHHDVHTMLCKAFELSDVKIALSQGYNPMPRLEISEPLPLGYESMDEYGFAIIVNNNYNYSDDYKNKINDLLHGDLQIKYMNFFKAIDGLKVPSLSSKHWGSAFRLFFEKSYLDIVQFIELFPEIILANPRLLNAEIISCSNLSIDVLLPFTGIKELGLSSIFKNIYGSSIRESGISVTRIQQYAKKLNGERTSYDDIYKAFSVIE